MDSNLFKRLLCISLPTLDSFDKQKNRSIDLRSSISGVSRMLTNVDILNPETYFFMHLPLISLIDTEMAMTPGVELSPQNPKIIENEHEPSENLPQLEIDEMEEFEVEKLEPVSKGPLVLIYHTHTTEAYMPSEKYNYKPRDKTYHTEDLNYSVVRIGKAIADEMNRLKIPTMHNKTVHDIPTYMTSYTNSLKTVEQILKQNSTIKIVVDLHRDAPVADPLKSREITTVNIDGIIYSRFMLVVGTDKTFPHPNWKENYRFANLLNDKLEQLYPGISRGINLRSERFNQHLSKKAILLEIGSHGNTMEESLNSAKIFAKVLVDLIGELSIVE
ncbi:MAG TPA: stage II sporulation protein P [Thermoanaerobacterales bacterium]|nr:stage II sporulation protein P [Thermoanaerobacterales bacterium]